nr:serine/threonine-protein kinase [Kibdelosporangium sp. MJ126-NF4]CEL17288.1 putative serine/threonine protein kinase [Kibdelosporangium sp. MJ126-NF4]CTQ91482.1 putative serine/threonine protein kinase [Kibdelosporangium sp. MJ126-NF4]
MGTRRMIDGRYRLEEQLGSGGMGVVWRATDEDLDRVVALKRALYVGGTHDQKRAQLLKREARTVAKVNHPNVVTLYNAVMSGDELWLVMEYLPASTLASQGVLPPAAVARVGVQLADALDAIHRAGVLHRDVKPSNVLMTADGRPKLGDFGVSRSVHNDVTISRTGGLDGTPGYLAPEVARGEDATEASDVFSLGATLFAAVEGVPPVGKADNPQVLVWRAATGDINESHGPLGSVLSALLHPDPRRRPTAARAKEMLADAANGLRQRPRRLMRAAIVLVLVATGVVVNSTYEPRLAETTLSPKIGDPHTADPCALLDATALGKFGSTELDADYGNFNRCDVLIRPSEGPGEVDVRLEFAVVPPSGEPPGQDTQVGQLPVIRYPGNDGKCTRRVTLPGERYSVPITTKFTKEQFPVDLCAVADEAVANAVTRLQRSTVARRQVQPVPESLINLDACALPSADALSLFPGVDANNPRPQFGDWECQWLSTTTRSVLTVRFDQHRPLTAAEGKLTRIAGRPAAVKENGTSGPNTCKVNVEYRQYTDNTGRTATEALHVIVLSDQIPNSRMCQLATAIAEPIAAKLPG